MAVNQNFQTLRLHYLSIYSAPFLSREPAQLKGTLAQLKPTLVSIKPKTTCKQHPFPVTYLVNSCGLSLESAIAVSDQFRLPVVLFSTLEAGSSPLSVPSQCSPQDFSDQSSSQSTPNLSSVTQSFNHVVSEQMSSVPVERCKARLVAKEYSQQEDVDYTEIFSPVVKMVTVRTLLALTVMFDWPLYQMDVYNVFLQDVLEEVYMELPKGFSNQGEALAFLLQKSISSLTSFWHWNLK
ncbi:hypothetical protein F3Y22_tig00111594pilonHSYRG00067 [Hibiscus syriacus]|uniref:Reverse transcriptase Ty1/copia-type domain-containing protein n=1 Tax=Hibiscus syriacus TaxID=106335 RepID=A0A6A2Y0A0_HIBSY|nr:hypothetical protein F3Y22_tig00111594pilonHSYRG00067 [Hibiscus syriacus]